MRKLTLIVTMLVASAALAGKKSDIKLFITGAAGEGGLANPDLMDSAKDLQGKLDDFVLVTKVEDADVVVTVTTRGKYAGHGTQVTSSTWGVTAQSTTIVALASTVTLRDGRSTEVEYAFDGDATMVAWRGMAGALSKKIRKFIEANEETIRGLR